MRAGALRETGDVEAARVQSREALELAKDSGFPPAANSARLDLLYVDLMDGDAGAAEGDPDLAVVVLEDAKGFHQFLWSIRLTVARAEAARLAARDDEAIELAHTALAEAGRFGRRKYECLVRITLAARSCRPAEQRRPPTSPRVPPSRPSGWGTTRRDGRRSRPSRTRRRPSATMTPPRTHTGRRCGASRSLAGGLSETRRVALLARPDVVAARTS